MFLQINPKITKLSLPTLQIQLKQSWYTISWVRLRTIQKSVNSRCRHRERPRGTNRTITWLDRSLRNDLNIFEIIIHLISNNRWMCDEIKRTFQLELCHLVSHPGQAFEPHFDILQKHSLSLFINIKIVFLFRQKDLSISLKKHLRFIPLDVTPSWK